MCLTGVSLDPETTAGVFAWSNLRFVCGFFTKLYIYMYLVLLWLKDLTPCSSSGGFDLFSEHRAMDERDAGMCQCKNRKDVSSAER